MSLYEVTKALLNIPRNIIKKELLPVENMFSIARDQIDKVIAQTEAPQ